MAKSNYYAELILDLNTRLFNNAIVGVTDEQAHERISGHNNPFTWIVTHTVWARYNMCALLGKPAQNPYAGMFEGFKPHDPATEYPSMAEIKTEWNKASAHLKEALSAVTEEHLKADAPFKNPTGDLSIGGTIAFLAQHESYDIGQVAFLKKYHTKEAMSYN